MFVGQVSIAKLGGLGILATLLLLEELVLLYRKKDSSVLRYCYKALLIVLDRDTCVVCSPHTGS